MNQIPLEIERKFLIRMPNLAQLSYMEGVRIKEITQTYLLSIDKRNSRVRKSIEQSKVSYTKTSKKKLSALSHFEEEYEITEDDYNEELKRKDPSKNTVFKVRYCIPLSDGHIAEIDIYPFWNDRAVLEIELASEEESFIIPEFVSVIKEISLDGRYKNTNLAKEIPFDTI